MKNDTSGIYVIRNINNNKIYIGSAFSFYFRWALHIHNLKKNKHHSPHLQRSWNKNSKDSFVFEVIEYVEDKNKLIEREQNWIDFFRPEYNCEKIAGSSKGRVT